MASSFLSVSFGNGLGTISLADYQRSGAAPTPYYRGWADNYVGSRYADTGATAGGDNEEIQGEEDMRYIWTAT